MLSGLYIRLRSLFRRAKAEQDLDEELRFHLEQQAEKYMRAGMSREDAMRRVRLEFGGIDQIKQQCREARGVTLAETLAQDLRYALRILRRSPGFTAVVVLTLALGIGANTAVFSIVDAVLLRPLPYRSADRLVMVAQHLPEQRAPAFDTYREFEAWSRYSNSFDKLAAATWARDAGAVLSWHGEKREILAVPVSVNFFSMLGVRAAQGRTFESADSNRQCTVVLAYPFWKERLGGASGWIGKSLALNNRACTVIGVMPKDFSFYPKQTALWTLITQESAFTQKPWDMPVVVFGLLKPAVSRPAAQAELASIESRIIAEDPSLAAMKLQPDLQDLQAEFTWLAGRNLRRGLLILFAVVGLVLLIACVNVANLLLGRATERQKELGVRAAIGAGRSRLIRQLLTESMVLSLAGASLGALAAILCVRLIDAIEAAQLPPGNPVSVNWEVLLFTTVLAILTGILFGLVPAWKASRIDLCEVLKQSAPSASRGALSHRTSRALVIAEVALSLVVLTAAGLLIESLIRLTDAPLGYQRDRLLTAEIHLPASSYPKAEDWMRFWDRLDLKMDSLPGVTGVAFAPSLAVLPGTGPVTIEGTGNSPRVAITAGPEPVSAGYFHVLGIPLLQGREFSGRDGPTAVPVAIVNQAFAREFFPKKSALGQQVKLSAPGAKGPSVTIVGVVGNVSNPTLYMGYAQRPCIYRPLRQDPSGALSVFVRTAGKPRAVESGIGRAVAAVDSNLPVPTMQTIDESLGAFMAEPQFRAELFGILAALALLLAAVGIYGVLSQLVSQRTHEIGIRIALGARREDVLGMIIGEGLKLAAAGIAIGFAAALVLARLLSNMLYGVGPADPLTFMAVSLLLAGVALLACYIPARRATQVDPVEALRYE